MTAPAPVEFKVGQVLTTTGGASRKIVHIIGRPPWEIVYTASGGGAVRFCLAGTLRAWIKRHNARVE